MSIVKISLSICISYSLRPKSVTYGYISMVLPHVDVTCFLYDVFNVTSGLPASMVNK